MDGNVGFSLMNMFLVPLLITASVIGFIGACLKKDLHEKFIYVRMYIIGLGIYLLLSIFVKIVSNLFGLLHPLSNLFFFGVGMTFSVICPILCCGTCIGIGGFYAYKINTFLPAGDETLWEKIKNTTKIEKIFTIIAAVIIGLFIFGVFISLIVAAVRGLNPKFVYIQKFDSGDCTGKLLEGSGRAALDNCMVELDGTASSKVTYKTVNGKRTIVVSAYLGSSCTNLLASANFEENKCQVFQGKSQKYSLF